jgi:hypothetical protein
MEKNASYFIVVYNKLDLLVAKFGREVLLHIEIRILVFLLQELSKTLLPLAFGKYISLQI